MPFLTEKELKAMGFKHVGRNVNVSPKVSIYCPENISIGDNSRIDDFCVLSAGDEGIFIGDYVHIACYSSIIGKSKIILEDFCNISGRVSIYSSTDDFSGACLTNPTIPAEFKKVINEQVILEKHVVVGAGSVILPGVVISEGAAIGALSLVSDNCESFWIYGGVPVKKIKERNRDVLQHEKKLILNNSRSDHEE